MLQPRISVPISKALFGSVPLCMRCQRHAFQQSLYINSRRQFTSTSIVRRPASPAEEPKDEAEFVPRPLGRPIGFQSPPQAGQNLGIKQKKTYTGTMSERNLEKRKDIVEDWGRNYFRDFKNIRKHHSGKTFMANPKVFKRDVALYFPNFHGQTLAEDKADTTPVLQGKISVVNIYSSQWGEIQAHSFTAQKANPELAQVLQDNKEVAQMVDINIEENIMKAWIITWFKWRMRRVRPKEDWGKYFVVQKGVSDRIRETIGMLNGRVGYVYLLDERCKIRWAGSGNAEGTEKEDLAKGLQKLIQELQATRAKMAEMKAQREFKNPVEEELEAQAVNAGAS